MKIKLFLIAISFFIMQLFPVLPVFAQTTVVSGTIQKIEPMGGGQFELTVQDDKGITKYIVDSSTLVQAVVPAKEVKVGDEILPIPKAGTKRAAQKKSPFANMPPAVRKALGLPDIPNIPQTPDIPKVPQVPKTKKSEVPSVPEVPKTPKLPKPPQAPGKAPAPGQAPAPGGPAGPGEAAPAEGGQMAPGGGMPSGGETQPKKEEKEIPEPPKEARSSVVKPEALSAPTPTLEKTKGQKVLKVKETSEGLQVEMKDESGSKEKTVIAPDEKVLQFLSVGQLEKNMTVKLEVVQSPEGNYIQRVTVV